MTPIQTQSLPAILEGKDLLAQAKTGSGKTAAFAIGLLHKLEITTYQVQAMILCPTRELADQVTNEIRRLARSIPNTKIVTLCGGKSMDPQLASLEHQPHIVVGTPGRILKHLDKGSLKLDGLKTLVLDEADRMPCSPDYIAAALDGLGPQGGDTHGPNEWVDLDSFAPQIKRAAALIHRLTHTRGND